MRKIVGQALRLPALATDAVALQHVDCGYANGLYTKIHVHKA